MIDNLTLDWGLGIMAWGIMAWGMGHGARRSCGAATLTHGAFLFNEPPRRQGRQEGRGKGLDIAVPVGRL
ncbi:MAG: hypothetical protein KME26_32970 [Oscillatoria princeps RMCB-10]|nr:hypothetical protein [Oscillatoria princeps RMCB-10]